MSGVTVPVSLVAMVVVLATYGLICACRELVEWWRRDTRGEFHCDKCGHVKALPKDDN